MRLLYVTPGSSGDGSRYAADRRRQGERGAALELWCFQANTRGRRFYESPRFRAIRFTDGAHNEERVPDVRYRWERRA